MSLLLGDLEETNLSIEELTRTVNIATLLSENDQRRVAQKVYADFALDKLSRSNWEERMSHAMQLALLVRGTKTYPWANCSNVKFPLITVAALQHHALIYPALIAQSDLVKCKVIGPDQDGEKFNRAQRVQDHMSYQLLEEDEGWEADMDRALIVQPILGCAFKKTYYCREAGHVKSSFVSPADLYIPYHARSLEESPRITHAISMEKHEVISLMREEVYIERDLISSGLIIEDRLTRETLQQQGLTSLGIDEDAPIQLLEQHCRFDLDGDGLSEPYIVTIRRDTKELLRIVARYAPSSITKIGQKIIRIEADDYFTKIPFIPSPDGGIYDLGWGILLAPLSESIDSIINQSIDSGTMSITAGGFLGRGARLKAGDNSFGHNEWKMVQGTSDDLRKHIYPYPSKDLPAFMFQLLNLLIGYGERLVGATDTSVGENPGQNTPAETSRTMVRESRKIYNGVYKRTWRALRDEMRKIYKLNSYFLPDQGPIDYAGQISRKDYNMNPRAIAPSADPSMLSDTEQVQIAIAIKQTATNSPGYDLPTVERRFLKALKVPNIQEIYRPEEIQSSLPWQVQVQQMKIQVQQLKIQANLRIAMAKLLSVADVNKAKIAQLQAGSVLDITKAKNINDGHQIALFNAQVGAAKAHQDGLLQAVKIFQEQLNMMEDPNMIQPIQQPGIQLENNQELGNVQTDVTEQTQPSTVGSMG